MKRFLICVVLIALAFGIGFGWGYLRLREAQKKWTADHQELQTRMGALQQELGVAQARLALWEVPVGLSEISAHLAEKNFGLATKAAEQLQDRFTKAQSVLGNDWKGKFDFFLPGLEEIRREIQNLSPAAKSKTDDLRSRFEQVLRSIPAS